MRNVFSWFAVLLLLTLLAPSEAASQGHVVTTIAGTGLIGPTGDGGPATEAAFANPYDNPTDIAIDPYGSVYIADWNLIRRIDRATGTLTSVVGIGLGGPFPPLEGVPGLHTITGASGIAFDRWGNLFVADGHIALVRRVDAASGLISRIAGTGTAGFSGDGGPPNLARVFNSSSVSVSPEGDICIADTFNERIRRVNAQTQIISTIAGNGNYGISSDGSQATQSSISNAVDVAFDGAGNCYFADRDSHRIRRIDRISGILTTVAGTGTSGFNGDDILATAAQLRGPSGLFFDVLGNLYIADTENRRIRRVDAATGIITTVATDVRSRGIAMDRGGNLYFTEQDGHRVQRISNTTPIAIAGTDATYPENQPFTLDGSGSFDPDSDSITYQWRELGGPILGNTPTISLNRGPGHHRFVLTVTDSWTGSRTDEVRITVGSPPAYDPPWILGALPAHGTTEVAPGSNMTVAVSKPIQSSGHPFEISCSSSGVRTIANVNVSGGPISYTLDPAFDFTPGEICTGTIFAEDISELGVPGNHLAADYVFSFAIAPAIRILASSPHRATEDVLGNTHIYVAFSEPVQLSGEVFRISCFGGVRARSDVTLSGGPTIFKLDPHVNFSPGDRCSMTFLASDISDFGTPPRNMFQDYVFSFSVSSQGYPAVPYVLETIPANGATGVPTNSNITVTLNEPIESAGNPFRITCSVSGERTLANTIVAGGPVTFVIDPQLDFTPGETCSMEIFAADITDLSVPPVHLAQDHVFSFQIAP